ncbi:hypothetical protein ACWFNE_15035 [Cellulomonas sp. NPDC055163]
MATATRKASTATTKPSAVDEARETVARTTSRHADAERAASAALTTSADLSERLRTGDESVSAAELMSAQAEAGRAAALLDHATQALADAKAAYAVVVATDTASTLAAGQGFEVAGDVAEARATITAALVTLRSQVEERNVRLADALAVASDAGLMVGEADPLSPVLVRPKTRGVFGNPVAALIVNGETYSAVDADATVAAVLAGVSA